MGLVAVRHKGEMGGIQSEEGLDDVIKQIGLADLAIDQVNNELHLAVVELEEQATKRVAEIQAARAELLAVAETFVGVKRDELLGKLKSKQLNFGKFGFRKLPNKLQLPKRNTDEMAGLIAAIEEIKEVDPEYPDVEIKLEKYVLKAAVNGLSPAELQVIGLRRTIGRDEFFVEPDRAKVKELQPA